MAGMYCLKDLLKLCEREGAEELCLETGKSPIMLVRGQSRALDLPALTSENVAELFGSFAGKERLDELSRCGDVHFHHTFDHFARYAIAASMARDRLSVQMKYLSR